MLRAWSKFVINIIARAEFPVDCQPCLLRWSFPRLAESQHSTFKVDSPGALKSILDCPPVEPIRQLIVSELPLQFHGI